MTTSETSNRNKIKHIPQRTCVACRKVRDKRELIRLVSSVEGSVDVDTDGKMPGRGAYLCREVSCWEDGLNGKRLEYALKTGIGQENKTKLLTWIRTYLENNI